MKKAQVLSPSILHRENKVDGFTLIEILVVVTIMVLMTAGAVVSYSSFIKQSRDAKRKADLSQLGVSLEMYRSNNDLYIAASQNSNCANATFSYLYSGTPKYIESMPTDPKNGTGFNYSCDISSSDYTIGAYLEGGSSGSCGSCGTNNCNYCLGPYGEK